jgi:hypothetical protein
VITRFAALSGSRASLLIILALLGRSGETAAQRAPVKVILDTDIGTDIDVRGRSGSR